MSMNELMEESEASILHTYNRFPVVFEKGEGCHLYDSEGKEYLDFAAGIAVNALGYHYPGYDEALKAQIDKLMHISNLYYNEPIIDAGAKQWYRGYRGCSESCQEICLRERWPCRS